MATFSLRIVITFYVLLQGVTTMIPHHGRLTQGRYHVVLLITLCESLPATQQVSIETPEFLNQEMADL